MKVLITNGLVFDTEHKEFFKKDILLEDERIREVLDEIKDPEVDVLLDVSGKYVTPGLIDTCSSIGLKESGIGREGNDSYEPFAEEGMIFHVRDGIYPFDTSFRDALEAGVTASHVMSGPESVVGAVTAVIHSTGSTFEEMCMVEDLGISFSMGDVPKQAFFNATGKPLTRMGIAAEMRKMMQVLNQSTYLKDKPIFIRCHRADDLETALRIAQEVDRTITLVHATEYSLMDSRWANQIQEVIVGPAFQPIERNELMKLHPSMYRILHEQQKKFVFASDHPKSGVSNLKLEASLAIREGVPENEALYSLTKGAAELLSIDHITGTIETGKFGDIVIWDQHPMNLTATVQKTFIKGTEVYSKGDC
ncbi:amidohydrolase family protein [Sporosarcina obsidiansis]|uniref:amidohydrolase family protein n=1 Tax=Sporosarcina obsidiansis TaxID=2660748 RepID=UPI0018919BFB|nr:amidohydrolase family protein [Sporosarcina obsidiansis]